MPMFAQRPPRHKQQDDVEQQPVALMAEQPPTSRLCVKNIPKYVNEQRLRDHFSVKGQVTDVKILKTRDGQPRQMAFVGYRTVEDAAAALKYFDNTFVDTCRISLEFARRYRAAELAGAAAAGTASAEAPGDTGMHRPWSKYSVGSSKHQQMLAKQAAAAQAADDAAAAAKADKKDKKAKKKAKAADAVQDAAEADPKLAEFLQLMQPRAKAKIWSNDEVLPGQAAKAAAAATTIKPPAGGLDDAADDELYEDLPAQRSGRRAGVQAANGARAEDTGPEGEESDSGSGSESESEGEAMAAKDAVVVDEGVSDLDYLRARMRQGPAAAAAVGAGADDGGSGSEDEDDSSSSSGDSEEEFDEEAEFEQRRQRQHIASTSDSSGSDSEEGGSDADVMQWQQQAHIRSKQQQQQQQSGEGSPPGSDSEAGSDGQQDGDSEQPPDSLPAASDDDMDVDGDQAQQPSAAAAAGGAGSEAAAAEAAVRESGRLFVRNLAYTAGQLELSELFGQYGDLEEVHLVLDRDTRRSKGIAYVKYLLPEDAVAAYRALDMTPFQGRLLHVLPARRKPGDDAEEQVDTKGPTGYKADKEAQQKRDAGNRSAWSTLFMRSDTVAAAVAAHYGVSKAQLLDASAEDLPLRMALGEVQVIAQTKAALADGGINTKALEAAAAVSGSAAAHKSVARSSSSLLVKNLPYSADVEELQQLFTGPGRSLLRLVLPPTKTLAVVEFAEPQDARAAFKALAYKKYQQVPLYLEWAPKDIWDSPPSTAPAAARVAPAAAAAAAAAGNGVSGSQAAAPAAGVERLKAKAAAAEEEEEDAEQAPVVSIYVKNLNFSTTDAALKAHFDKAISAAGGQIHSAKVARRKGPDGKLLSMGYGFVETDSEAVAQTVIKQLQGTMLDKHKLTLQLSKRGATAAGGSSSKANKKAKEQDGKGAKLVVRNVAFEATRKDIMGLFGPFGHIKSCRLPKKFDGNHRGFAFLEFTTKQEAANALEGVGGTHLYGRRVVVEYAQADAEGLTATGEPTDLQQARAKTAAKFFGTDGRQGDAAEAAADAPARKRLKRNL